MKNVKYNINPSGKYLNVPTSDYFHISKRNTLPFIKIVKMQMPPGISQ